MNKQHGTVNPNLTLNSQGIKGFKNAYYNLLEPDLISHSLNRDEGELGIGGVFLVETGKFTGRSPKDKHIVVSTETVDKVWWERNAKMSSDAFNELHKDMLKHIQGKDLFVQDLYGGADPKYRIGVRVITEYSWHSLFIRHLLIRPTEFDLENYVNDFSIINLPTFSAPSGLSRCGPCPHPSNICRTALSPMATAIASLQAGGVTGSIVPPITRVGQVIPAISSRISICAISSVKKWTATSGR